MADPSPELLNWINDFIEREDLPPSFLETALAVALPLADRLAPAPRPWLVGICGAQGSGKSTLSAVLARLLQDQGLRACVLSLDDVYLTRAERLALAADVHPLFATRGPPGTHDLALCHAVLDGLSRPGVVRTPMFNKSRDDRRPPADWPAVEAPVDLVILEGWCVGARPPPSDTLDEPVNDLERDDDPQGIWRRHSAAALAGPYARLFARIDLQVLLAAPGFEVVAGWRREQERKLRDRLARDGGDASRTLSDADVDRFVAHYERWTRWILEDMPDRADVVVRLDALRRPTAFTVR